MSGPNGRRLTIVCLGAPPQRGAFLCAARSAAADN